MSARFKMTGALASLAIAAGLWRCLWLWQPERQLLLHQEHLLRAVEDRNWHRIEGEIDPAYADRWGHSRASAVREGRQWLGQFFALSVTSGSVTAQLSPTGGVVTERLALQGTGTAMAQMAQQAVNGLQAPFIFEWRRTGWKPWAWTLVRMDNSDLQIDLSPAP